MRTFDIIIPYFNGDDTIGKLIQSIPSNIKITVVDDQSTVPLDGLNYPNVRIIKSNRKRYFTGAVNIGIQSTDRDVLVLNQDTSFTGTKWQDQLENALERGFGYIGERIQGDRPDFPHGYIHGTFMYMRRDVINKVGLLDEKHYPLWGSTAEYQLRVARANFKILPLEHIEDFVHDRPETQQFGSSIKTLLKQEPEQRRKLVQTPPLVTVVIPVYNFSKYLESTVNSLIGGNTSLGDWKQQTFGGFEIVIVDDSSTDDTPKVIENIVDSWKGVRSIRLDRPRNKVYDPVEKKYIGKPTALNEGIKSAYGKYILILDADDMCATGRLEAMVDAVLANPNTFVYDKVKPFTTVWTGKVQDNFMETVLTRSKLDLNKYTVGEPMILSQKKPIKYSFDRNLYKNRIHNSIMFSKADFAKTGGYREAFKYGREDWQINTSFGANCICGFPVDFAGLYYRRDGQNRTRANTDGSWMTYFRTLMLEQFKELYDTTPNPRKGIWDEQGD